MKELAFAIIFLSLFYVAVASDLSALQKPQAPANTLVALQ